MMRTGWFRGIAAGGVGSAVVAAVVALNPTSSLAVAGCEGPEAVVGSSYHVVHLDGSEADTDTLSNVDAPGTVRPGDVVSATLHLNPDCDSVTVSGAAYTAPSAVFSDDNQKQQVLFSSTTGTFRGGDTVRLTVTIPGGAGASTASCPNPHLLSGHTYNGNGSPGSPYASTCDGTASQNGRGGGGAGGKPCAGCVGNADNKNPAGQQPGGSDHNAGYECDRNQGVGKTNPAHTGCLQPVHFQVDFVVGPVLPSFVIDGLYVTYYGRLIPGGSTLG